MFPNAAKNESKSTFAVPQAAQIRFSKISTSIWASFLKVFSIKIYAKINVQNQWRKSHEN